MFCRMTVIVRRDSAPAPPRRRSDRAARAASPASSATSVPPAHRDADVGGREGRRVVDAVADHRDHAPSACKRRRRFAACLPAAARRAPRCRAQRPTASPVARLSPVSMTGDAGPSAPRPPARPLAARRGARSADRLAVAERRPTRSCRRCSSGAEAPDGFLMESKPPAAPTITLRPFTGHERPCRAWPRRQSKARLRSHAGRPRQDRRGQRMRRPRFDAAASRGPRPPAISASGTTSVTLASPSVSVPVLSNAMCLTLPIRLDRRAALDQQAAARAGRKRGGDRGRRRDHQRARTADQQQRQGTVNPACTGPPKASGGTSATARARAHDRGHVVAREAIDEPLGRRLRLGASSTRRTTRAIVLSVAGLSTARATTASLIDRAGEDRVSLASWSFGSDSPGHRPTRRARTSRRGSCRRPEPGRPVERPRPRRRGSCRSAFQRRHSAFELRRLRGDGRERLDAGPRRLRRPLREARRRGRGGRRQRLPRRRR